MKRCLELARKGKSSVAPNPMVGAVVVYDDKIIGEGYHRKYGESHAEVHAIHSVEDKTLLEKSTLYVNLEPCSHSGKTPPCCELISSYKIPKVVIGCGDTSSKVNGKGITHLKNKGIEVKCGVLKEESMRLNRRFFTFQHQKRPYIILKWAESADGFMDRRRDKNEKGINWISRPNTKLVTHQWRSEEACILVGRKTIENDNPSLTTREVNGPNPVRLVIDPSLKLKKEYKVFNDDAQTYLFNYLKNQRKDNVSHIKVGKENFLSEMLTFIYDQKWNSILVEGGASTINQFLEKNLWDEARVIIGKPQFNSGLRSPVLKQNTFSVVTFNDDKVKTYLND